MNGEEFQRFSNLLFFENYLEDEKANYVTTQHGYLFRRDAARLVAHKIEQAEDEAKHFLLELIEKGTWDKVQLVQEDLHLTNEQGEKQVLSPVETPFQTNSLQSLFLNDYDTVFHMESKSLVKVLLILQRKLLNQALPLHEVDVVLNWKEGTLSLVLPNETSTYQLTLEVEKEGKETSIAYSYLFFRDLFIHANSFNKHLTFSIYQSYFTKIDYDEKTKAVLNHKRKNTQES